MAFALPPPDPLKLHGNLAENFKTFEQSFNTYLAALGLDTKPEKQKSSTLLHVMGEGAVKIYNGFIWADDEDKNKVDTILKKLKDYCTPRKNLVFERSKFNDRTQKSSETFDEFYSDVSNLAKSCEFGDMENDLIRDRICVGVYSKELKSILTLKLHLFFPTVTANPGLQGPSYHF